MVSREMHRYAKSALSCLDGNLNAFQKSNVWTLLCAGSQDALIQDEVLRPDPWPILRGNANHHK